MTVIDEKFRTDIGNRLLTLRKEAGLTREAMVEALSVDYHLDIDEKTLRRYEKGTYMPKIDNLISLSDFFNVSLDFIIIGKQMSDDNSFTWKDALKRLNRLVFSSVLIPEVVTDNASPFYGKYHFIAWEEEVSVYMERLITFMKNQNYNFEVRGKRIMFDVSDLDKLIGDFEKYEESLTPSKKRLNDILIAAHEDPNHFLEERLKAIAKKRKV